MSRVRFAPSELEDRAAFTFNSVLSDAEICRQNGWKAGTWLIGDEGYGPCIIRVTAIGRDRILAICDTHGDTESVFALDCRDWHDLESRAGKYLRQALASAGRGPVESQPEPLKNCNVTPEITDQRRNKGEAQSGEKK